MISFGLNFEQMIEIRHFLKNIKKEIKILLTS